MDLKALPVKMLHGFRADDATGPVTRIDLGIITCFGITAESQWAEGVWGGVVESGVTCDLKRMRNNATGRDESSLTNRQKERKS